MSFVTLQSRRGRVPDDDTLCGLQLQAGHCCCPATADSTVMAIHIRYTQHRQIMSSTAQLLNPSDCVYELQRNFNLQDSHRQLLQPATVQTSMVTALPPHLKATHITVRVVGKAACRIQAAGQHAAICRREEAQMQQRTAVAVSKYAYDQWCSTSAIIRCSQVRQR